MTKRHSPFTWVMLGYTALVVVFFVVRNGVGLRLVAMYDRRGVVVLMAVVMLILLLVGWGVVAFRTRKAAGVAAAAVSWAVSALLLPLLLITSFFAILPPIPWQYEFFASPQGTNQVVVFLGGDCGATCAGPFFSVYPMVLPGVIRRTRNSRGEVRRDLPQEINAQLQWLSEREVIVNTGGEEFHITF